MTNAIAQIVAQNEVAATIAAQDKQAQAAQKKARTVRTAQKPAESKASKTATKAAQVLAIKYSITAARPGSGRPLRAYTEAVLQLLGMYKGKEYPRAVLAKIIGDTALAYHLNKTGALAMSENGIGLTPGFGADFFGMRTDMQEYDLQDMEDYKAILANGKADGRLVKNPAFIKALAV